LGLVKIGFYGWIEYNKKLDGICIFLFASSVVNLGIYIKKYAASRKVNWKCPNVCKEIYFKNVSKSY
jgi:hypothetical protein